MNVLGKLFLKGLAVVIPVTLTGAILWWMARGAEDILGGLLVEFLPAGWYIPGMGLVSALAMTILIGLLTHNVIDFAIFEPGVMTSFWAVAACLIALDAQHRSQTEHQLRTGALFRFFILAAVAISVWALFNYALLPVARTTARTRSALKRVRQTHELLAEAATLDPFDPAPLTLNARLYVEHYEHTGDGVGGERCDE